MTTKKIQHYQVSQPVITLTSIFIMFLTVYIVIAILADIFMTLPSEVSRLIHISDIVISIIFMRDFVRQYRKAPDKKAYFL